MTAEKKKQIPDGEESRAKRRAERTARDDEQSQATIKDFDEEGMGVAPKE